MGRKPAADLEEGVLILGQAEQVLPLGAWSSLACWGVSLAQVQMLRSSLPLSVLRVLAHVLLHFTGGVATS